MQNTESLDPEQICRICLKEKLDLFLIFDGNYATNDTPTIAEIITQMTRYRVERFDDLPHQVCEDCMKWAQEAYRFRSSTEKAYRKLISIIGIDEVKIPENYTHVEVQTENVTLYCDLCNINFLNIPDFQKHRLLQHSRFGKKKNQRKCHVCGLKFNKLEDCREHILQDHVEQVMVNEYSRFICNLCSKDFGRKDNFKRHLQAVHKLDNDKVDLELTNEENHFKLSGKIEEVYTEDKNLELDKKCIQCDRSFRRKEYLKRHLRIVHKELSEDKLLPGDPSEKETIKENSESDDGLTSDKGLLKCSNNDSETDNYDFEAINPFSSEDEEINIIRKSPIDVEKTLLSTESPIKEELLSKNNSLEEVIPTKEFQSKENHSLILNNLENQETLKEDATCVENIDSSKDKNDVVKEENVPALEVKENSESENESFTNVSVINDEPNDNNEISHKVSSKVEIIREYLDKNKGQINRKKRKKYPKDADMNCAHCKKSFTRYFHLQRHLLTHMEDKPHVCPHCEKSFARSDHLKKHIICLHDEKGYKCDKCDGAFARKEMLIRHKSSKHGEGEGLAALKNHQCHLCEKKFVSKSYLQKHILLHTERLFACKHCELIYKNRKEWREHERTHTAALRKFLCNVCGESFVRADYLRVHMRRHNGEKPYKCQYCDKGFPRATDLKMHERYHTGTKPNVCSVCNKAFHRAYNLTIHMRTHTGERPYKCDQCSKSFTQSNDLKAHVRRHTGERFKCNNCDAAFLQMYALRQHAFNAHGIKMAPTTGRLAKTSNNSLKSSKKDNLPEKSSPIITNQVITITVPNVQSTLSSLQNTMDTNVIINQPYNHIEDVPIVGLNCNLSSTPLLHLTTNFVESKDYE